MSTEQIVLACSVFRAAVAILAGAALGLAGALLQRLLRNPIVNPSTLGVSAGARPRHCRDDAVSVTTTARSSQRGRRRHGGAGFPARLAPQLRSRHHGRLRPARQPRRAVGAMTLSQGEYLMSLVTWNGGNSRPAGLVRPPRRFRHRTARGRAASILLLRPLALFVRRQRREIARRRARRHTRGGRGDRGGSGSGCRGERRRLVSFVGLAAPALVRGLGVRSRMPSSFCRRLRAVCCSGSAMALCNSCSSSTSETFPTGAMTALISEAAAALAAAEGEALEPARRRCT